MLGDIDRARALLGEADAVVSMTDWEPTAARDWRFLVGDEAAARKGLEAQGQRLQIAELLAAIGQRDEARTLADGCEAAVTSGLDLTLIAEARIKALRDRRGAAAALARAIDTEAEICNIDRAVDIAVKLLGLRATRPMFERRTRRAATFDEHLGFARTYANSLADAKARDRHAKAALDLAEGPRQVSEVAQFLQMNGGDLGRTDQMFEAALAQAKDVDAWIFVILSRPDGGASFFRSNWPQAAAMAGRGNWAGLLDHAGSFEDPQLSRLVLDTMETADADAYDCLRAAEAWLALGEAGRAQRLWQKLERHRRQLGEAPFELRCVACAVENQRASSRNSG